VKVDLALARYGSHQTGSALLTPRGHHNAKVSNVTNSDVLAQQHLR
jgi:hypothetical protein